MCELLALSSQIPVHTGFSLKELASHSQHTDARFSNHDGWGVAYFEGKDATLLREPQSASDSQLVRFIEKNIPPTQLLISHIRKATQGKRALWNTQPFARELGGCMHVFAHNGDFSAIQGLAEFTPKAFTPIGSTDSEHAFCYLLDKLKPLWDQQSTPSISQRYDIICKVAEQLRQYGPANFLYADSELLFVHAHKRIQDDGEIKPPGLYLLNRHCDGQNEQDFKKHGLHLHNTTQEVSIIASVPLTDEKWQPIKEGKVLVFSEGRRLFI